MFIFFITFSISAHPRRLIKITISQEHIHHCVPNMKWYLIWRRFHPCDLLINKEVKMPDTAVPVTLYSSVSWGIKLTVSWLGKGLYTQVCFHIEELLQNCGSSGQFHTSHLCTRFIWFDGFFIYLCYQNEVEKNSVLFFNAWHIIMQEDLQTRSSSQIKTFLSHAGQH